MTWIGLPGNSNVHCHCRSNDPAETGRGLSYKPMSFALMFVLLGLQTDGYNAGNLNDVSKNELCRTAENLVQSLIDCRQLHIYLLS